MNSQASKFFDAASKIAIALLVAGSVALLSKFHDMEIHIAKSQVTVENMSSQLRLLETKVDAIGRRQQEVLIVLARIGASPVDKED